VSSSLSLSIVIPVYNEEAIIEGALLRYLEGLEGLGRSYELIVAANGCRDQTVPIVRELMTTWPSLRLHESDVPNYGRALRAGLLAASGDVVVCDEIDLCDLDFVKRALRLLDADHCDVVVGSKAMPGARDRRPFVRRAATRVINGLLRAAVGFQGTDTHGLKAMKRHAILPVVAACVVDQDLFASELVIRAGRAGLRLVEIPIELEEQRSSPVHLVRRVPRVLRDLGRLVVAVHLEKGRHEYDPSA
jgi:glycosyltransferase involved in cell wall biosynthesis